MSNPYRVVRDYTRQYENPIAFLRGDALTVERRDEQYPNWYWCSNRAGQSGWVHQSFFEDEDYRKVAIADYDASELTVTQGERLEGEEELDGWLLASTQQGQRGWVPLDHVERLA